jgi:hypothetical protein
MLQPGQGRPRSATLALNSGPLDLGVSEGLGLDREFVGKAVALGLPSFVARAVGLGGSSFSPIAIVSRKLIRSTPAQWFRDIDAS